MKTRAILAAAVVALVALPVFAFNKNSGLQPGDKVIPFHPEHISGPLKGTTDCFPCTYGNLPSVQAWVHGEDAKVVDKIIAELQENISSHKDQNFKALLVMIVDKDSDKAAAKARLLESIKASKSGDVAVALVNKDHEAVKSYKINLDSSIKNTVFFYKNRTISNTMVNMKMNDGGCTGMCEHVAALIK